MTTDEPLMPNEETPRRKWIRDRALPLAKQGLSTSQITKKLLPELPRGYEDSFLAPGITKEVGDVLRTSGLRLNVGKAKTPAAAGYKDLTLFDYKEIVAFAAHRDAQIDADEQAMRRDIEAWCAKHPKYTVDQVVAAAKQLRAQTAKEEAS